MVEKNANHAMISLEFGVTVLANSFASIKMSISKWNFPSAQSNLGFPEIAV